MREGIVGYVPLDSRPVNYQYPLLISEIAGIELLTPPKEFLGDLNTCGNAGKICSFLKEKVNKIQALILSIDMLAYGGLIFSRKMNTSFQGAYQRIQTLRELKKINPELLIYAFNVILRISISVEDEESYKLWNLIFRYSILKDKVEKEKNKNDELQLKILEKEIPGYLLEEYFTVRRRNHNINVAVIHLVKEGIIDFLILSQEDAAEFGPHKKEQEILQKIIEREKLDKKVSIQTGCDEIGMQLLAKYFNNLRNSPPRIFFYPPYFSLRAVPLYEDVSISKNLRKKINSLEIETKNSYRDSDFVFFINTFENVQKDIFLKENSINSSKKKRFLLEKIKNCFKKRYRISIADIFYCNGADEEFVNMLKKEVEIPQLLSYAGWNTASNTIGCALSHSCIAFKIDSRIKLRKNLEFLFIRFLEDFLYSLKVRPFLNEYLQKRGISPYNIKREFQEVVKMMQNQMKYLAEIFFEENFKNKSVEVKGEKFRIIRLKKIEFYFPWRRTFEIGTDVHIEIK